MIREGQEQITVAKTRLESSEHRIEFIKAIAMLSIAESLERFATLAEKATEEDS